MYKPAHDRIIDAWLAGEPETKIADAEHFPVQVVTRLVREEFDALRRFRARMVLRYGPVAQLQYGIAARQVAEDAATERRAS